jgi:hypothetical protein
MRMAEGGGIEPHALVTTPTVFKTALPPSGGAFLWKIGSRGTDRTCDLGINSASLFH